MGSEMYTEPSRELDALIAEKIFSWTWVTFIGKTYIVSPWYREQISPAAFSMGWSDGKLRSDATPGEVQLDCHSLSDISQISPLRPFSTDIAAAWKVVEKLNAEGWEIELSPYCNVVSWVGGAEQGVSIPHTICLVALKAVGVENVQVA